MCACPLCHTKPGRAGLPVVVYPGVWGRNTAQCIVASTPSAPPTATADSVGGGRWRPRAPWSLPFADELRGRPLRARYSAQLRHLLIACCQAAVLGHRASPKPLDVIGGATSVAAPLRCWAIYKRA